MRSFRLMPNLLDPVALAHKFFIALRASLKSFITDSYSHANGSRRWVELLRKPRGIASNLLKNSIPRCIFDELSLLISESSVWTQSRREWNDMFQVHRWSRDVTGSLTWCLHSSDMLVQYFYGASAKSCSFIALEHFFLVFNGVWPYRNFWMSSFMIHLHHYNVIDGSMWSELDWCLIKLDNSFPSKPSKLRLIS